MFSFNGLPVPAQPGQTVAAALWAAGIRTWRTTRGGAARGLFCGIGACHDCLATIDGTGSVRACLVEARPGMTVESDHLGSGAGAGAAARASGASADIIVVGAGPAGLAAAATAALADRRVALVDAAPRAGGQFWRHPEGADGHGHRDWRVFEGLMSIVEDRVEHLPDAAVWFAEAIPGGFRLQTTAGEVRAERLVLATGAHDRALPFLGWELPGVVTPGAAQALWKGSGTAVGRRVVVAGAGPFLLPVAVGLAEAGVRVVAVVEAGEPSTYLRRPGVLAGAAGKLGEAAGYAAALARRRIPYLVRHAVVAAYGDAEVSHVDIVRLDRQGKAMSGSRRRLDCDAVAVGYGFTANLELALALGCRTVRGADGGLAVDVDADGTTSTAGVWAAGEVTGVGGSSLAIVEGILAGAAATTAGGGPPAQSARDLVALRRRRGRLRAFADVVHAAHAIPGGWPAWLGEQTLVCRCEEVTVGRLRHAVVELGARDARTVKLLARPGMGWCQGRVCGYPTAALTASLCGRDVTDGDLVALAHRPIATAVRLGELASDPAIPIE
jgi:NADPH-dependent 2,4-dienoyl-CoA reductase/sulfur reductase-like enzyme